MNYKAICYSGGFDSSFFIIKLAQKQKLYKFIVFHFVHCIRKNSDQQGIEIMNFFACWGVQCIIGFNLSCKKKYSQLRQSRYCFIFNSCFRFNVRIVYILNNYNDFIENLIIRINIGSSLLGMLNLCGYSKFYYYGIVIKVKRPLFFTKRKTISACVPYIKDPTNLSNSSVRGYMRNFYRTDQVCSFGNELMFLDKYVDDIAPIYIYEFNVHVFRDSEVNLCNLMISVKKLLINLFCKVINNIDNTIVERFIFENINGSVGKCSLLKLEGIYVIRNNDIHVVKINDVYILFLNNIYCYKLHGNNIYNVEIFYATGKYLINIFDSKCFMKKVFIKITFYDNTFCTMFIKGDFTDCIFRYNYIYVSRIL